MLQILRTSGLVLAMIAMVTVSFASEKAEKETRQLESFTKLSLSGDLVINLTDGYKNEVSIIGTETERNNVATELVNGIMKIYLKEDLNTDSKVYVYLTVSSVEFIQVANGAKLSSYAPINSASLQLIGDESANIDIKVNSEMLRCNLRNSSKAKIQGKITSAYMSADNSKLEADIQSVDVTTTAQNKAEMYFVGKTQKIVITAKDNSSIDAAGLQSRKCTIDASEDSLVNANSKKRVSAKANDNSYINIIGSPSNKSVLASEDSKVNFQ